LPCIIHARAKLNVNCCFALVEHKPFFNYNAGMTLKLNQDDRKKILLGIFLLFMFLANTLGTKITTVLGIRLSVGILFMPILFVVSDIVGEVYGKREASSFVWLSSGLLVVMIGFIALCIAAEPNPTWTNQEAYKTIFGSTLRMSFASVLGFVISQLMDVFLFSKIRKATKGRMLWLRNNVSTIVAQALDTTIFMFLAFYRITPKYDVPFIFSLIWPYFLCKVVVAIIDTPLCYLGVKWLKAGEKYSQGLPEDKENH
jgi:uncharacterized integral membrane protein (TIGR00697 family)